MFVYTYSEIIIGNIYWPPRMLHDLIKQFINELTVLVTNIENKKEVILAGDYNLNLIKMNENEACSDFLDMLTTHFFHTFLSANYPAKELIY